MPFTVDDTPFGSLSVTLADVDSTLAASIMATAPATLSLSVGTPGPGVPVGGSTGMVLKKVSGTDYDTAWQTDLNTGVWGSITGTLSNQTDLQTALNLKADLASPALTGVPTAPTAATLTSTTQIATTAFVQQELAAGTAVAKNLEVYVRNQSGATLAAGTIVYIDGATGNRPTVTKAQANNDANSAQTFGFTKTSIANNGFGYVIVRGELENVDTSALTEGQQLYLSPTTAGTWTTTKPSAPDHLVYVGIVVRAHPTQGIILVAIQNGYELNELHDVKITSVSNGQVLKYDSTQGLWVNGTDSAGVAWGGITGTLSSQTDLQTALDAKATAADYLSKAGNLSGLADTSVARTNLGLGTMATETASNYLTTATASSTYAPLASPALTGTPTAPTAAVDTNTTQLATTAYVIGQVYLKSSTASSTYAPLASPALTGTPTAPTASAGTNTTQIATTAFVQTAAPDASTTTKGKVELATVAEAQDGGSTSLVPTVEGVTWMLMNDAYRPYFNITGGTSGTGSATNPVPPFRYAAQGPSSGTTGHAYLHTNNYHGLSVGKNGTVFNFSKKCWVSFSINNFSASWIGDSNNELKTFFGLNSLNNGDDPNGRAIGVWKQGGSSSYWNLMVHNGTTLTKVATTTTMPTGLMQRFLIYSDGSGNVKLFIDGTEVASTSSGPTGDTSDARFYVSVKQNNTVGTRIMNETYYPKIYAAV